MDIVLVTVELSGQAPGMLKTAEIHFAISPRTTAIPEEIDNLVELGNTMDKEQTALITGPKTLVVKSAPLNHSDHKMFGIPKMWIHEIDRPVSVPDQQERIISRPNPPRPQVCGLAFTHAPEPDEENRELM
jgi:hypothetical protein